MTISQTPLARKIRALMAKANDKSVGEHEAAAFMNKVQELLVQNGLSMGDVKQEDVEQGDIEGQTYRERWKSPSRRNLLRAVCRYYMCEAVSPHKNGGMWTIIGRPHNVTVAIEMTDYLIKTTVRLSGAYGRANIGVNVIDFRKGCMGRLCERLQAEMQRAKASAPEYRPNGNPGNLPALFKSEAKLVDEFMRKSIGGLRFKPARPIKAGQDAAAGRAAGDTVSLHGQVGQQRAGRVLIGRE